MATEDEKKKPDAEGTSYVPPEQDRIALENFKARRKDRSPARLKVRTENGVAKWATDPPGIRGQLHLMQALATSDPDFVAGILPQLMNASRVGQVVDEAVANFMLSAIKGIGPKDPVETMLAAQMVAVHMATMTFAGRLSQVETLPQQDSAERAFNKLMRTFATQVETLKRYRTGGEQKVTVQHVSVSEGGQAIVGNFAQAPRENAASKSPFSSPAITDAKTAPMAIIGESKPMPIIGESKKAIPATTGRRKAK